MRLQEEISNLGNNISNLSLIQWVLIPSFFFLGILYIVLVGKKAPYIVTVILAVILSCSFIAISIYVDKAKYKRIDLITKQDRIEAKVKFRKDSTFKSNLRGKRIIKKETFKYYNDYEFYFSIMTDSGKWKGEVPKELYVIYDEGDTLR